MKLFRLMLVGALAVLPAHRLAAQSELIKFGDFDQWVVRNIKESRIIGGQTKQLYEVAPAATWDDNRAYTPQGGSPWGTSNVMAKVCGITKTNTSVYREPRGTGYCARLETHEEKVRVMGMVNIEVLAAGSIFLGAIPEPITSTSNPMSKLSVGMPYTRKPKAISFDYKVKLSGDSNRIRQTGFSKVTTVKGKDMPDVLVLLQKRWEDAKGNIHAKRIGTMIHRFGKNTEWVNGAEFPILYGDITHHPNYGTYMGLMNGDDCFNTKNSKGKIVPIHEEEWGNDDDEPTHIIVKFDSSYGGAYIGSVGTTLWVDNVKLVY